MTRLAWTLMTLLAIGCGDDDVETGVDAAADSAADDTSAADCNGDEQCPAIGCVCLAGADRTTTVEASRCESGVCASAAEVCPSACEAGTLGGSWTGETE